MVVEVLDRLGALAAADDHLLDVVAQRDGDAQVARHAAPLLCIRADVVPLVPFEHQQLFVRVDDHHASFLHAGFEQRVQVVLVKAGAEALQPRVLLHNARAVGQTLSALNPARLICPSLAMAQLRAVHAHTITPTCCARWMARAFSGQK